MASDGDLWGRALARGLDRDGALAIVRPGAISLVVAGRRVHRGGCVTEPAVARSGLYRAARGPDGALKLTGVDQPQQVTVRPAAGEGWDEVPLAGRELMAIVEQSDPAAHADE